MNVLYGLLQPDHGTISSMASTSLRTNPKEAIGPGSGMVPSNFMLVEVFTWRRILITVGRKQDAAFAQHGSEPERTVQPALGTLRAGRRPGSAGRGPAVGVQQRVEILKPLQTMPVP